MRWGQGGDGGGLGSRVEVEDGGEYTGSEGEEKFAGIPTKKRSNFKLFQRREEKKLKILEPVGSSFLSSWLD